MYLFGQSICTMSRHLNFRLASTVVQSIVSICYDTAMSRRIEWKTRFEVFRLRSGRERTVDPLYANTYICSTLVLKDFMHLIKQNKNV